MSQTTSRAAALTLMLVSAVALVVSACGVGSGGTGSPQSASAQGTVNGFGSVIVDGVRYDDSMVATTREDEPGAQTRTQSVLGDTVEVAYESANVASRVLVDPALIGSVTSASGSSGFVVLGQQVLVNNDAARGPITQFSGGYTGAGSVTVGNAVEVHGVIVRQTTGFYIQATRVGRLAALPAYLKATGLVSLPSAGSLNLGVLRVDISTGRVLPQNSLPTTGAVVSLLAPASSLVAGNAPRLTAAQVRVKRTGSDGEQVATGGIVTGLDSTGKRFVLGGVNVAYGAATVTPTNASLANGSYVRVSGQVVADGSVQAASVTVRDGVGQPEAELRGNIKGYVAASRTFTVRGTAVNAASAVLEGCPASGLAEGLSVEVEGRLGPTAVIATKVQCGAETADATVERTGPASAVDIGALSFVVTPTGGASVSVRWTATTYFAHVTPSTLAGRRVHVSGKLSAGVLTAQTIEGE